MPYPVQLNFKVFYYSSFNELKLLIKRSPYTRSIPFGIIKIGSKKNIYRMKINPVEYYEKIKLLLESNYAFLLRSIRYIMRNYDLALGKAIIGKVIEYSINDENYEPRSYYDYVATLSTDANYVWYLIHSGVGVLHIRWANVDYHRISEFAIYKNKIKYTTDLKLGRILYIRNFVRLGIYTSGSLVTEESDADVLIKDFPTKWFVWEVNTSYLYHKIIASVSRGWICILECMWHKRINRSRSNHYSSFIKAIILNNVSYIIAPYIEDPLYKANLILALKSLDYTMEDFIACLDRDKLTYKYNIFALIQSNNKEIMFPHGVCVGQDLIAEYKLLLSGGPV